MRHSRMKLEGGAAVYHCVTRTVAGEHLLDEQAKEVLRRMLWQVAGFCGVEVMAYCLMSNHFHVLVAVPEQVPVARKELLRRYRLLYAKNRAPFQPDPDVLERILSEDSEEGRRWESRLNRRMADVSEFMKTLKQRFSVWYNKSHQRFGTLWAERFKSLIVQGDPVALQTIAAYIDLNPVRAGLVEDPANYRWCSYAEAMGGRECAQRGLTRAIGGEHWRSAGDDYRMVLYGKGATTHNDRQAAIPHERALEILSAGGALPRSELVRCRVRYFTDGAVIGSASFVERFRRRSRDGACRLPLADARRGEDIRVLRNLRSSVFG